jgi:predicted Zn-dependent protease
MSYENPDVPHEVNVSRDNALIEFLRLLAAVALCVAAIAAALYLTGGWLARRIPFSTEQSWVGDRVLGIELGAGNDAHHAEIERYLQALGGELAAALELPDSIAIRVHYAEIEVANAFATLGGHIVVTSELYRRMPSENALAMMLAHEIAHVKARDPISALGSGASLALVFAFVSGEVDGLAPQLAGLVQLGYSRSVERRADREAIAALRAHYGHAGGGASLFEVLADQQGAVVGAVPSFLSTHPADAERIAELESAAADWDAEHVPLAPIRVPAERRN